MESAKADKVMSLLESKMVRSHACQCVSASMPNSLDLALELT